MVDSARAITRAIADQARTIRIPVHMVETINKLIQCVKTAPSRELGEESLHREEIAKEMSMPVERVREDTQDIAGACFTLRLQSVRRRIHILVISSRMIMYRFLLMRAAFTLLKEQLEEVLGTLHRERAEGTHTRLWLRGRQSQNTLKK